MDNPYKKGIDDPPSLHLPASTPGERAPGDFCYTRTMELHAFNTAWIVILLALLTLFLLTFYFPLTLHRLVRANLPVVSWYDSDGRMVRDLDAHYRKALARDRCPYSFLYASYSYDWSGYKVLIMGAKFLTIVVVVVVSKDNCLLRHHPRQVIEAIRQGLLIFLTSLFLLVHWRFSPYLTREENLSQAWSRATQVFTAILLLPYVLGHGISVIPILLIVTTSLAGIIIAYYILRGMDLPKVWVKRLLRRLSYEETLFVSPYLRGSEGDEGKEAARSPENEEGEMGRRIRHRVWQESWAAMILCLWELRLPRDLQKEGQLPFLESPSGRAPYLLAFEGTVAERFLENARILRHIGLQTYERTLQMDRTGTGHGEREAKLRERVMEELVGPDVYYPAPFLELAGEAEEGSASGTGLRLRRFRRGTGGSSNPRSVGDSTFGTLNVAGSDVGGGSPAPQPLLSRLLCLPSWQGKKGARRRVVKSFWGKAYVIPFPWCVVIVYDEDAEITCTLSDPDALECLLRENTRREVEEERVVRRKLRALDNQIIRLPATVTSPEKGEVWARLRIWRISASTWQGQNMNAGFQLRLILDHSSSGPRGSSSSSPSGPRGLEEGSPRRSEGEGTAEGSATLLDAERLPPSTPSCQDKSNSSSGQEQGPHRVSGEVEASEDPSAGRMSKWERRSLLKMWYKEKEMILNVTDYGLPPFGQYQLTPKLEAIFAANEAIIDRELGRVYQDIAYYRAHWRDEARRKRSTLSYTFTPSIYGNARIPRARLTQCLDVTEWAESPLEEPGLNRRGRRRGGTRLPASMPPRKEEHEKEKQKQGTNEEEEEDEGEREGEEEVDPSSGRGPMRNLVQNRPWEMEAMFGRMEWIGTSALHRTWYVVWDEVWRYNWSDIPSLRRHPEHFSPYYPTSLCYRPMSRRRLEAYLGDHYVPGWRQRYLRMKHWGYVHPGFLNRLYALLHTAWMAEWKEKEEGAHQGQEGTRPTEEDMLPMPMPEAHVSGERLEDQASFWRNQRLMTLPEITR